MILEKEISVLVFATFCFLVSLWLFGKSENEIVHLLGEVVRTGYGLTLGLLILVEIVRYLTN